MEFNITADNKSYIDARGKIILNACPGSGKTSAISFKLTKLTKECEDIYGSFSGVACLSFTNVAKDEIIDKFKSISNTSIRYPHLVSTIDSFINQFITLPFYYLLNYQTKRPIVMDTVTFLDNINLGWFPNKRKQPLKVSYPPSKLKVEIDGTLTWDGNKPSPKVVDQDIFDRYAKKFKNWQYNNGYINNDDSTYFACLLLEKFPEIGKSLVQRFPYIIIDEAQDTSEIQYKIFDLLIEAGLTNLEYVGDPYQSLYEFRQAKPDLFLEKFNDNTNWQTLRFRDCRRSSQRIIDNYSLLRTDTAKIVSACNFTTDHKIKVIRYDVNDLPNLIERYKTVIDRGANNQILVRGSTHLEQFGVKVNNENPWKTDVAKKLIQASINLKSGNTKSTVDTLRMLVVELTMPEDSYKTHKLQSEVLRTDIYRNIILSDFARGMPTVDDTIKNWTENMTSYIKTNLNIDIDLQLKQRKGAAYYNQNLKEFLYPTVNLELPVSTIHKVKGMTFHSILLVLSDNSSGEKISLSDFVRPNGLPGPKQRMIYVALSRPEGLSCIAIPDSFTETQIIERLGNDIDFI